MWQRTLMQAMVPVARSKGESFLGSVFLAFNIAELLFLTPTSAFDFNPWISSSSQR